jgi:hypothetical protein
MFDFEEFFDLIDRSCVSVPSKSCSMSLTLCRKRFVGHHDPIFTTDHTHISRSITFFHPGLKPFMLIDGAFDGA